MTVFGWSVVRDQVYRAAVIVLLSVLTLMGAATVNRNVYGKDAVDAKIDHVEKMQEQRDYYLDGRLDRMEDKIDTLLERGTNGELRKP